MNSSILTLIKNQHQNRITHNEIGIKVNLYKGYEVEAVANAAHNLLESGIISHIDCLMVADSYLMTHLGLRGTRLSTQPEQELFFKVLCDLVYEVRVAISSFFLDEHQPYLIADMPDGSTQDPETALRNANRFLSCGADVIKIEVPSEKSLSVLEYLGHNGILVMAHIGYTPQKANNRLYGTTISEAKDLFHLARQVRDTGACALVLERVNELVNEKLCINHKNALPIYSIFSGKAQFGGQSLNVWDSVYHPPFTARFFPPTAKYDMKLFPKHYDIITIKQHFQEFLRITLNGRYPLSLRRRMRSEDIAELNSIDPWVAI
ncbi:MAG: 3-methyl-2-oxobutanoate hydroxymethyltransferase [Actinomycetia bacterium]|nr:3-methyl-2-oxobutanoate hydroxymethyltransferase [Actinomycetes bacterium]